MRGSALPMRRQEKYERTYTGQVRSNRVARSSSAAQQLAGSCQGASGNQVAGCEHNVTNGPVT